MPTMQLESLRNYIANLPVGAPLHRMGEGDSAVNTIDINNLPNGIVTGSNLIQFPADASPELKSSVALSLLAAQRVATNDPVVLSPAQWLDRHNTVLQNLNWRNEGGGLQSPISIALIWQYIKLSYLSSLQLLVGQSALVP